MSAQPKCAICGKPVEPRFRPFCSKRCADVDLQRWFSGGYAIAAEEPDPPTQETPEQDD
ncbi:MAG: DNA gyrase inhibitor YacG [Hyphomonadaceae bacterium]